MIDAAGVTHLTPHHHPALLCLPPFKTIPRRSLVLETRTGPVHVSAMNRRQLLRNVLATSLLGIAAPWHTTAQTSTKRRFTIDLTPGAIGVKANPHALLTLAAANGFESVQPNARFLAGLDKSQRKEFADELRAKGLTWGSAGMPVDFRKDADTFHSGLSELPKQAAALKDAGATRISTWIKPYHDSLTYLANFHQHAARLREVTKILADHDLRFGLEYVGTRTLWTRSRHSFIHTMAETKELVAEIDQTNLGFVLDSWHWFTAGETAADILTLKNSDIVACDLNDAPAGIPVAEQLDNRRELPAATGVIPIADFLRALATLGYDGPVRAEPFNRALNALDDGPAAKATANAIRKAIARSGT